jgi:hypothetical protein
MALGEDQRHAQGQGQMQLLLQALTGVRQGVEQC